MELKKIYLASKSPRRRDLLQMLGVEFEIIHQDIDESIPPDLIPAKVPEFIARQKLDSVINQIPVDGIGLSADTIVLLEGEIYGKPESEKAAKEMLLSLSGKTHEVITGVYMSYKDEITQFSSSTFVTFKQLTESECSFYIETYKPLDKAGSYAIQEWLGLIGIEKIEGDYYNIVGLPVQKVYDLVKRWSLQDPLSYSS